MVRYLHILNGDSTHHQLVRTSIEGDVVVWRDVLAEGPVINDFASHEFWKTRLDFMTGTYGITKKEFEDRVILEFAKAEDHGHYQEVVLWFEYDLFCQINMIGILSWLKNRDLDNTKISLICAGRVNGYEGLVGLGEVRPDDYGYLFENRVTLTQAALTFASNAFLTYCSDDPTDLFNYTLIPAIEFPYLGEALKAHFTRFPSKFSRLNAIESKIVDLIEGGVDRKEQLIEALLRWQYYFGFGDLQFENIIRRLSPIISKHPLLALNEEGKQRMKGDADFKGLIDRNYYLGGANVSDWLWDDQKKELISSED